MNMMNEDAFNGLNAVGDAFRTACKEVLKLTDTEGEVQGQYSIFSVTFKEPWLNDTPARGAVYRSSGMHQYMVQNGFWMSPGMVGVCSTIMDLADVAAFSETLKNGLVTIKEKQAGI